MATVLERVRKIIVEQLGVEEGDVNPQTSFVDDLNADSLDLVELIMAMEEEFSKDGKPVEISDEQGWVMPDRNFDFPNFFIENRRRQCLARVGAIAFAPEMSRNH